MTGHNKQEKSADFGFVDIPAHEKSGRVAGVFHSVASRYDVMNDLMSFGLHRLWKKFALLQSAVRPGQCVLDVASGTGDLVPGFLRKVGPSGHVVMTDINESMLLRGRDRLLNQGFCSTVSWVQADAENLPFQDSTFDCVSIAFGLRNVTDKSRALAAMYRVLKPGGRLLVLEFSHPVLPFLKTLYDRYSFHVIPRLGEWVCHDGASYQYLVESIRRHPDQSTLAGMMRDVGFESVDWNNLTGGIVALHRGFRSS